MIVGFLASAFDLLHPGHLDAIRFCKSKCTNLVLGLHVNPSMERSNKNRPVQTVFERWSQLSIIVGNDHIIPYETEGDLRNIYATIDLDKVFVGEEYKSDAITGQTILQSRNVEIIYIPRLHSWSSTELRKRLK